MDTLPHTPDDAPPAPSPEEEAPPTSEAPRPSPNPTDLLPTWGHMVVLGMTGSGKTTLVRALLRHRSRVLVVDPKEEYLGQAVQAHSGDEVAAVVRASPGRWRIAYFNTHLEDDFGALAQTATNLGRCTFVVEETDWYCSPSAIHPSLAQLLKYGRPRYGQPWSGVEVWCIARRPAELHRLCTSQASTVFCFLTTEPADFDYLRRYVSTDFASDLGNLPLLVCKQQRRMAGAAPVYWEVDPRLASIRPHVIQSGGTTRRGEGEPG